VTMPSSPSPGGGASNRSGAPWRPSRLVRDHGCGMLAFPETGAVRFKDPLLCPRGRFIFDPSRGRSLRSPDGLAFEDAFGVSRPGFRQAPLMGFSKTAPPSTSMHDVHSCVRPFRSPGRVSRFSLPLPRAGPVPPSRFLTALTAFSVAHAAGLLHPAADPGVHRVRLSDPASRPRRRASTMRDPSKVFPRLQLPALPGFCPLTVRHPRMARSRGLAPLVESVASSSCCHVKEPDPPLGFTLSSPVCRSPPRRSGSRGIDDLASGPLRSRNVRTLLAPKRSPGSSRSSSQSHRPGVWTGSTGLSA